MENIEIRKSIFEYFSIEDFLYDGSQLCLLKTHFQVVAFNCQDQLLVNIGPLSRQLLLTLNL